MKKQLSITAIAAIMAFAPAPAAAQDPIDSYGTNEFLAPEGAEPVNFERPKKMKAEADDTSELAELLEFVPKNETIIIPQKAPEADTAKKEAKKEEKAKVAGPKIGNSVGGRLGLGNVYSLGIDVGIGISDRERINLGLSGGFGSDWGEGYSITAYEMTVFYDWRYKLSDDGALCVYAGPGVAFGSYSTRKEYGKIKPFRDLTTDSLVFVDSTAKYSGATLGVGGQAGLDIDLSFIDPDHSLKGLRRSTVCVDFRPILYVPLVDKYPVVVLSFGVTWRFLLGKREE